MQAIDAVISWVDGKDPSYQQKLKKYCQAHNLDHSIAIEPTRIYQDNEIYFCLLCLQKYTPWLRNIFIVTNQQTPSSIQAIQDQTLKNKIKIIDQNELLANCGIHTPIFNSLSVEWLIWKIPGLSSNFIYLCDDFFITRPLQPEDFFENNKIKTRGQWKVQSAKKFGYKLQKILTKILNKQPPQPKTNPHRSWQEKCAQLAGLTKKFYLPEHAPFALNTASFESYLKQNPQALKTNASLPFRSKDHISSVPLITHLDIINKRAIQDSKLRAIMVNGKTHSLKKIQTRLNKVTENPNIAFLCMQSIDQSPLDIKNHMLNWLQKHIETV